MITEGLIDEATGRELSPTAEIELWACNALPFDLYRRCRLEYVSGMGGAQCIGLSATEIRAGFWLSRVKPSPELCDDLQLMGSAAAQYLNERKH